MESCKFDIIRKTSVIPIYFIPQKLMKIRFHRGFTLIELLLVIGIIAILASIVIVAINPTKQLGDARNAQRRSDVNTVLNAVYQYAIDNNGTLPGTIPSGTAKLICESDTTGDPCTVTAGGVDLSSIVGTYIVDIPEDPQDAATGTVGYTIVQDANGRVTVAAPSAEQSAVISVTR
ncbi:MAG: hypothetical protein UX30_C0004G0011 [Candidatus Saccharibacteria bacterium GW2011_GWA2_46_10]|nr:MAG: hypothetical protein UX30_C0004G0011 [Candidatus Saccharibacteria bacterium GW2011_GWA2_46_10]